MLHRLVLAFCLSTSPVLAQGSFSASYQGLGSADFTLVEEDVDGTFIVVGESRPGPAFVTRLDASGQVMWARSISAATATVLDIEIASNGDILLCGSYQSGALGMRLDSSGTMIWTTQLPFQVLGGGQSGIARGFSSVLESSTGQIFFGGNTLDPVGSQPLFLLASTDAQGTLLWESIFGDGFITDMVEQPGGTIAMVGASLFSQLGFARITPSGVALGWRSLEGISGQWPRMAQTPGGELLIVPGAGPCLSVLLGSSTCFGTYEMTDSVPEILRVDGGGNPIWRRALSSSPGAGIDVVATPDGGAVWLGEVGPTAADASLSVAKLDALGVVQWQTVYDAGITCFPTSMAATADGGFACTATCADGLAGPFRPILLRGDADGTVASCTAAVGDAVAMPRPLVSTPGSQTLFTSPVSAQAPDLATIPFSLTAAMECIAADSVGSPYCGPAASNSSGRSARAHVLGSHQVAANDVTLTMTDGPAGALGYFLAGAGMGTSNPPGSQGRLCLVGSTIYRFSLSAQVADERGAFAVTLPSPSIPNHGAILAGETWNFQAWFRDANPTVTSNFSDATSVIFQ